MNPDNKHIATNIMKARKACGWNQSAMAKVLGVNQASISLWETGKIVPSGSALTSLGALFGCRREELFKPMASFAISHLPVFFTTDGTPDPV